MRLITCLIAAISFFALSANASELDAPTVTIVEQGFGKAVLEITAGESGAPEGFTAWWMKESEFLANGSQMTFEPSDIQGAASFGGVPTLNTWGETLSSFSLAPFQTVKVEIGDLEDETGVLANLPGELQPGTAYVFCVSANAVANDYTPASGYSANQSTYTRGGQDCTYTQGYWKNHEDEWPVAGLMLGSVAYTQAELLSIFGEPVAGNGLISLAHQLIATKLNIANGSDPSAISATVASADALIGALVVPPVGAGFIHPSMTSSLTQMLDDYNNGVIGPGHCPPTSVDETSWGVLKATYR